jgi:hypothetical protein
MTTNCDEEPCPECDGTGWDDAHDDHCPVCESFGVICPQCRNGFPDCRCDILSEFEEEGE